MSLPPMEHGFSTGALDSQMAYTSAAQRLSHIARPVNTLEAI